MASTLTHLDLSGNALRGDDLAVGPINISLLKIIITRKAGGEAI